WLAWAQDIDNRNSALALYDCKSNAFHQVTSGFYNDEMPVFDPDGKYLFFRTGRTFSPSYSALDESWIYANTEVLAAIPLRTNVLSPQAPRNDEEGNKKEDGEKKDEAKKSDEKKESSREKKKPLKSPKDSDDVTVKKDDATDENADENKDEEQDDDKKT